jgi:hypothetical protein
MAHMIHPDEFAVIESRARELLTLTRSFSAGKSMIDKDAKPELVALNEEVLATQLALMGVCQSATLTDEALFIALGDLAGSLLGQSMGDRTRLMRLLFTQMRSTLDQVTAVAMPVGNA